MSGQTGLDRGASLANSLARSKYCGAALRDSTWEFGNPEFQARFLDQNENMATLVLIIVYDTPCLTK